MKVIKIIGILLLLVLLGVGGLIFYGLQNADSIIKQAVETFGSDAVGTQVTLEQVEVDLGQGRVELLGLQVANPVGYTTPHAFALNKIAVQININSLNKRAPIVIDEITIDQPSINAEEKGLSQTNLSDLANNLGSTGNSSSPVEENGSTEIPNIAITAFNFSRANMSLVSEQYGDRTIEVPSFSLKNVGGSAGLPPDQLAVALFDEIIEQANNAVKRSTRDRAREEVREKAKDIIDEKLSAEDKEKLDSIKSIFNR